MNKMTLCITHFNNKTLYENLCYNLNIKKIYEPEEGLFKKWRSYNIPNLEKEIDNNRIKRIRSDIIEEQQYLRKKNVYIKKDIQLLKQYELAFYMNKINEIKDDGNLREWVYNTPISIHPSINKNKIFVIEMNNNTNEIIGIAYIQSNLFHRRYTVYSDRNYNRYSYKGKRININATILKKYKKQLEELLFLGSTHQKRGQGIQQLASVNINKVNKTELINCLEELFCSNNI